MSMHEVHVSGTIREIGLKEGLTRRSGNGTFDVCTVTVQVRDSLRQQDGGFKWETICFCEASAFGQTAQAWTKRFKQGDAVELSGQFTIENYIKKDGTAGGRLVINGHNGGAPLLDHVARPFEPANQQPQGNQYRQPAVDTSDELF